MKNLILYGGDTSKSKLDKDWMEILGKKSLKIAYITYISGAMLSVDEEFVRLGHRCKYSKPIYFVVGYDNFKEIKNYDVIYLSGGNTFEFLATLRKAKLTPKLRGFVKRGGILCGMSAGAILLATSIKMASIPKSTADENEVGLKNLKALNLVDFHFCPHYETWMDKELKEFSKKIYPKIVVACRDNQKVMAYDWGYIDNFKSYTYFDNGEKYKNKG